MTGPWDWLGITGAGLLLVAFVLMGLPRRRR